VVDVSLYGATRETYEAVTRVKGSHAKCLKGIRRLIDAGIRVKLKTVLMTINSHEVEPMRHMAEELGVPFRIDNAIFPCLPDNDHGPLRLRVSPREAVQRELSDPKSLEQWIGHIDTQGDVPPSKRLYRCGAGVTSFYIDPCGNASPCLMTTQYRYSLAEAGFARLWSHELFQLRSKTAQDGYECNRCEMQVACGGCPASHYQETGAEDVKSDYVCETTRLRWEVIQRVRLGEQTPLPLPALPEPSSATSGPWRPVTFAGAADGRDPREPKA
jgi:radical SAM protein with 4Fe4S-binding SPASM domain